MLDINVIFSKNIQQVAEVHEKVHRKSPKGDAGELQNGVPHPPWRSRKMGFLQNEANAWVENHDRCDASSVAPAKLLEAGADLLKNPNIAKV